jgi:hypothetical protein
VALMSHSTELWRISNGAPQIPSLPIGLFVPSMWTGTSATRDCVSAVGVGGRPADLTRVLWRLADAQVSRRPSGFPIDQYTTMSE